MESKFGLLNAMEAKEKLMEAIERQKAQQNMPKFAGIYGNMKYDGNTIKAGKWVMFDGKIRKPKTDIIDAEENSLENNPDLWDTLVVK